jgi:Fungal specific transcription factor domain
LIPLEANELSNPMLTLLLPLALSDTAVMHALLCLSGIQYTAIRTRTTQGTDALKTEEKDLKSPPLYLLHKRHALVAIQKRLNDPAQATSDGTIAAITLLAGYEVRCLNHTSRFDDLN